MLQLIGGVLKENWNPSF